MLHTVRVSYERLIMDVMELVPDLEQYQNAEERIQEQVIRFIEVLLREQALLIAAAGTPIRDKLSRMLMLPASLPHVELARDL